MRERQTTRVLVAGWLAIAVLAGCADDRAGPGPAATTTSTTTTSTTTTSTTTTMVAPPLDPTAPNYPTTPPRPVVDYPTTPPRPPVSYPTTG